MGRRGIALAVSTLFVALALVPLPARAGDTPRQTVVETIDQVLSIAKGAQDKTMVPEAKDIEIRNLLETKFDLRLIAQGALRNTWPSLRLEERAEFTAVFAEFLQKKAIANLIGLIDIRHFEVSYLSESVPYSQQTNSDRADPCVDLCIVTISIKTERRTLDVPIFLRKDVKGDWKIYDVKPDGSLVDNYRSQYGHMLKKGMTFSGLLQFIRDRIAGKAE